MLMEQVAMKAATQIISLYYCHQGGQVGGGSPTSGSIEHGALQAATQIISLYYCHQGGGMVVEALREVL